MATAATGCVVVWEWYGDIGTWHPYPSQVSNYIEHRHSHRSYTNLASRSTVSLGNAEAVYAIYDVDLRQMSQIRKDTGSLRPIRRELYLASTPFGKGVVWEWAGDQSIWQPYKLDAASLLESAQEKHQHMVDLRIVGLPYTIDLRQMTQTKNGTGFVRQVQRKMMLLPYIADQGTSTSSTMYLSALVPGTGSKKQTSLSKTISSANRGPSPKSSGQSFPASVGAVFNSLLPSTSSGAQGGSPSEVPAPKRFKSIQQINDSHLPKEVIKSFTNHVISPEKEECAICCEEMTSASGYDPKDSKVLRMIKCKHQYHRACLVSMYESGSKDGSLQCPVCKCIHGIKMGNCPPGKMTMDTMTTSLPGYSDCGTIVVTYDISGGVQGLTHPNPGHSFGARGFPRRGHLPDNEQGRKVCRLLQVAWARKLTFTIGSSVTTGEQDTVVWNEIHHRTEVTNNSGHGYPDPKYLDNVLQELAAQGVTEETT